MTEIDRYVANEIRVRRLLAGATMEKVALACNTDWKQVACWESGAVPVGATDIFNIAHCLGVCSSVFFPPRIDDPAAA